jgi:PAS domain S-box-containing protein
MSESLPRSDKAGLPAPKEGFAGAGAGRIDFLELLFAHIADAIIVVNPAGIIIDANPAACAMFGYDREELLHMHPWDVVVSATEGEIRTLLSDLDASATASVQRTYRRKSGEVRMMDLRLKRAPGSGHDIFVASCRDLAEQKQTEARLRLVEERRQNAEELQRLNAALTQQADHLRQTKELEAEKDQFALVIDTIPGLVWSSLPDGHIDFLNRRWLDYTGMSQKEAIGWGWRAAIYPEDLPGLEEYWRSILIAQTPGEYEARLRRHDGVYRWFLFRGVPLHDGNRVIKWYGTNADIDDRRRAEEKLQQSEHLARGQLEALTGTLSALTRESSTEKFLECVLVMIARELGGASVSMWEWDEASGYAHLIADCADGHLTIKTQREIESSPKVALTTHSHPIWDEFFKTGKNCVIGTITANELPVSFLRDSPPEWHPWTSDPAFRDLTKFYAQKHYAAGIVGTLAVPAFLHGKVAALISIRFKQLRSFRAEEIELARALTHQAMLALQLIRLSNRSQEAAILAERTRLLQREEERLRRSEAYQAAAQTLSSTGSFGWRVDNGECTWSDEMCRLLGWDASAAPTMKDFFDRVHPQDRESARQSFDSAAGGNGVLDCQLRLIFSDQVTRYVHVRARPLQGGVNLELVGAVMDITERTLAAEALRASEHLARGQLSALTQTLASLARETDLNQLPKHVLSTISAQLGGHSVTIWGGEDSELRLAGIIERGRFQFGQDAKYFDGRLPLSQPAPPLWVEGLMAGQHLVIEDVSAETSRIVLGDGRSALWPISVLNPAFVALKRHLADDGVRTLLIAPMLMGGHFAGIVGIRFTTGRSFRHEEIELVKALSHQAMLAMKLMRLSEQSRTAAVVAERNRMARDLHDTLAQGFTGVIVQLEAAKSAIAKGLPTEFGHHLARASNLARDSLREARRSAQALRPQALAEKNLGEALQEMLDKMTTGTSLRTSFLITGAPWPLDSAAEENFLRIGQEVLTNALRHSRADLFTVKLVFHLAEVRLEMGDNGIGFDPAALNEGLGLVGIKERAEMIGGRVAILSAMGSGTSVVVSLPCPK